MRKYKYNSKRQLVYIFVFVILFIGIICTFVGCNKSTHFDLVEKLKYGQSAQRVNAAMELGRRKETSAIPSLIAALSDKESSVQLASVQSLQEIGDLQAYWPLMQAAASDKSQKVRECAALAALEISFKGVDDKIKEKTIMNFKKRLSLQTLKNVVDKPMDKKENLCYFRCQLENLGFADYFVGNAKIQYSCNNIDKKNKCLDYDTKKLQLVLTDVTFSDMIDYFQNNNPYYGFHISYGTIMNDEGVGRETKVKMKIFDNATMAEIMASLFVAAKPKHGIAIIYNPWLCITSIKERNRIYKKKKLIE